MKHSVTEMTPKEARKPSNELKVKLNLATKARKGCTQSWKKGMMSKYSRKENLTKKRKGRKLE